MRRLPAEWEPQDAVALIWPNRSTDWAYMLEAAVGCFQRIATAIAECGERVLIIADSRHVDAASLPRHPLIAIVDAPYNDTWARDSLGITVTDSDLPAVIDFQFNGWGLKFASHLDNMLTSSLAARGVFTAPRRNMLSFTLEGGSIESDGNGIVLTTSECLLSPNRNGGLSQHQIEQILGDTLGAKRTLWLDHGALQGDDTDSHIDTLARLAPDNTILYVRCADTADPHYPSLHAMEEQLRALVTADHRPYNLIPLPLPSAIYDEDGHRLPATYANFLVGNGFVLVPTYGQPDTDAEALRLVASAFPERLVYGIDCRPLIRQHGSLHCVTMQFPKNSINTRLWTAK